MGGGGCRGWLKFCISLKVLYFLEAIFVIFDCVDDSICNHHFFISFFFFLFTVSSIFHPNDECGWEMALTVVHLIRNHQLGRLFSVCLFVCFLLLYL